ncbi:alpha-L-glutamate ligase [Nanobdella aerobiophila]|uniref:Alpha-L-glutamate ligase n=1 Tax=Nanobdella aerobiophila TaxID=2586965 RepID=A0A915S9V2_9ARCH|nr:ATP-grasp domain-containing protein [Nanobdella aerobiophila]BBL45292.1 alpha-L-glutamate ligase [Nanobdella aerobiophila]
MKKIAILIRQNLEDYRIKRFYDEISGYNNIDIVEAYKYLVYPYENTKILEYDNFYFYLGMTFTYDSNILANYLNDNGKNVINKLHINNQIASKTFFYDKLRKYIKIPKFYKIYSVKNIRFILEKLSFPIMVKHQFIHRGEFVFKINNEEELYNFLDEYLENKRDIKHLIFQEYIPYEKDIRVIFIGKPFGAMQRINNESYKANISQGGRGKEYKIDKEIEEISYKISEKMDLQIFAFDLLLKENTYYLIDIHNIFQFEGFEKYLNKNLVKGILDYLNEI